MSNNTTESTVLLIFRSPDHRHMYHDLKPWSQVKDYNISKTFWHDEAPCYTFYNQTYSLNLYI